MKPVDQRARAAERYDGHVDAVYGYLVRRLGSELSRDVLADVFETAISQLDRYDPDRGSERAWLFGIATNMIRRHWRTEERRLRAWARAGRRERVAGDPLVDVVARLDAEDEVSRVMAAIAELPDADRDLLFLVAWEEVSYAVCAEILDIPIGTVRSRLHYIRRELRMAVDPTPREEVRP